ncbi:probable cytochrome P450 6a13 isoform X2 [Tribolium madens]|nr:probable cytochrome P450 6a13 isoform X2 [Tribolium madens]XP_044262897.1 probable cytochrome P450 6a13 isoform X2 [Tribolium madens]XP_044262898.1 probable cytochrome P450 6a13 isoform X2 [Tribolium madens]
MILIIVITALVTIIYYLIHNNYQYWKKRGIRGPKPRFFVGNLGKSFIFKASPGHIYTEAYNQFKNEDVVGMYRAMSPVILIRDPQLIKEVTLKSFNNFHDNDLYIDKNVDTIVGRNPFFLRGDEWKIVRQQLTPGFTSGKMKWLYPLLEEVAGNLIKFIDNHPETTNGKGYSAKELCARFTLNNVASCAFGIEGKCLEEETNEFQELAKEFFAPGSWNFIAFFILNLFPPLVKYMKIRFASESVERRLTDLVTQTVKYREENNIVRNDFLQILIELKKTCKDYEFTNVDVTAHAAGFLGDGYESSGTVMSFVLHEIAANPKVQAKLRQEVSKAFEQNGNKLPYDALQEIHLLDAVIQETLRCHPSVLHAQKLCTKNFTFVPKNSKKPVTIEEGTSVILPVYGLHHDPDYFEDPDSFKPERFLPANRENIVKYTYLPFGEGHRSCLGQRFGVLQLKVGIAYIINHYELTVNEKTQMPIRYVPTNAVTEPLGGLWLNLKKIK